MEKQNVETIEENIKEKSKNNKTPWIIVIILLLIMLVGGYLLYSHFSYKSRFDLDREALEGWLPGKSDEDIQAELNRIIDESRFNVAINPTTVVMRDGTANFMLENVPANNYWMQVVVYYMDTTGTEQLLYESKYIQQGYFIENAEVNHVPEGGEYDARAVFKAIIPESDEVMGETQANITIYVED